MIGTILGRLTHQDGKINFSADDDSENKTKIKLSGNKLVYTADLGSSKKGSSLASYLEKERLTRYSQYLYISPSYIYCKGLVLFGMDFLVRIYDDLETLGFIKKDKIRVGISLPK